MNLFYKNNKIRDIKENNDIQLSTSIKYNDYVYIIGGYNEDNILDNVYYGKINNINKSIDNWIKNTSLPYKIVGSSSCIYNNYVYVFGGCINLNEKIFIDKVLYAKINDDGIIDKWIETTNLPQKFAGSSCAVYNGYVYIIGGFKSDNNVLDTIYYAKINDDGTLDMWKETIKLPYKLAFATSEIYNGYMYVIGGLTNDVDDPISYSIYYSKINIDGTISVWNTTTSLTKKLEMPTSVLYNNYIYVINNYGFDDDDDVKNKYIHYVYYAKINDDGTIDKWTETTFLEKNIPFINSVIHDNYIYLVSCKIIKDEFNYEIYYSKINEDGAIYILEKQMPSLYSVDGIKLKLLVEGIENVIIDENLLQKLREKNKTLEKEIKLNLSINCKIQ